MYHGVIQKITLAQFFFLRRGIVVINNVFFCYVENWQHNFIIAGGVPLCIKMLTNESFLASADLSTRRLYKPTLFFLFVRIANEVWSTGHFIFMAYLNIHSWTNICAALRLDRHSVWLCFFSPL